MLSQWLWVMMSNAERVVMNHGVLCWASGCESWCVMLCQGCESWCVMLCQGCESWCVMLSQWLWVMVCNAVPGVWIMVCYAEPVVVNHGELWWGRGCESLCVMLRQWLCIMVCYAEPVVVNHGLICEAQWSGIVMYYAEQNGSESWCAMQSPVVGNHDV
jgi:hypothetical protein